MNLRPYQQMACDAVNAALAAGESGTLVVIPTGGGKTPVMAALIHAWLTQWPDTRVCVLAHTQELVDQNAAKFSAYWRHHQKTEAPMGIYCAGLNQRNAHAPVVFAGIQSVTKKAMHMGAFDVLLIDEAHHIPASAEKKKGIWRRFIDDARRANPNLRTVGLSATPYRLGVGSIVGDQLLFKRICYEISVLKLIQEGYLCPLTTHVSTIKADTDRLHVHQGEYVAAEVERLMDQDHLVAGAVQDMMAYGKDRQSWIVFCAGIDHAAHVCETLNQAGVAAGLVTGKTPQKEREATIAAFKSLSLRALCTVNVLSEGFDFPGIDLVALLRPTKSAGLYYQQVGRALRLSPNKKDALILDFAGVIAEHGPIDRVREEPKHSAGGDVPMKRCPDCDQSLHTSVRVCPQCGYQFPPPALKHDTQAAVGAAILSNQVRPIRYAVNRVTYVRHIGKSQKPTLQVSYYEGYRQVAKEWVCIEHDGYALAKAKQWLKARFPPDDFNHIPGTVEQIMDWIQGGFCLKEPSVIHVRPPLGKNKYPEIVGYEWEENSFDQKAA